MSAFKVSGRYHYGRVRYYPECDRARRLAKLMKVKSFTGEALQDLRALGLHFESVPALHEPVPLPELPGAN